MTGESVNKWFLWAQLISEIDGRMGITQTSFAKMSSF